MTCINWSFASVCDAVTLMYCKAETETAVVRWFAHSNCAASSQRHRDSSSAQHKLDNLQHAVALAADTL